MPEIRIEPDVATRFPDHVAGVTCRRCNRRQGRRTRLTEATRNAFFVFDRLEGVELSELEEAAAELTEELLRRWLAARIEVVTAGGGA